MSFVLKNVSRKSKDADARSIGIYDELLRDAVFSRAIDETGLLTGSGATVC